ncbi:MAG TPA: hypothetical protein VK137_02980, partial [Planctomycetaceae bacterium]|nr:hypothetical protein [Planctomycetaceae bacterium]
MEGNDTGSDGGTVSLASGTLFIGSAGATFNFPVGLFQWTGGILSVADNGGHTLTNAGTITLAGSAAKTLAAGSRKCGGLRRSFPSLRDDSAPAVLRSKFCRMSDDRLSGAGERTAPSTGHHTSPEFVREITSPALVVSAPGHSGGTGPKPRSVRQWNRH